MGRALVGIGFLLYLIGLVNVIYPLRFMRVHTRVKAMIILISGILTALVGAFIIAPSFTIPGSGVNSVNAQATAATAIQNDMEQTRAAVTDLAKAFAKGWYGGIQFVHHDDRELVRVHLVPNPNPPTCIGCHPAALIGETAYDLVRGMLSLHLKWDQLDIIDDSSDFDRRSFTLTYDKAKDVFDVPYLLSGWSHGNARSEVWLRAYGADAIKW